MEARGTRAGRTCNNILLFLRVCVIIVDVVVEFDHQVAPERRRIVALSARYSADVCHVTQVDE